MNSIRKIRELNLRELENGISPNASWHVDYRDTAYIYIGGLPMELTEGDVVTIFSQYGEPTYINLIRDKETGKSRGFAFLKYEDQRSTDLAVDNLGGAVILGRTLNVDHTRYKKKSDEPDEGHFLTKKDDTEGSDTEEELTEGVSREKLKYDTKQPACKAEQELEKLQQNHDDEDPMKSYFIQEKKDQIAAELAKNRKKSTKSHRDRHLHSSSRRSNNKRESSKDRHPRRRSKGLGEKKS
ncbi:RNA binding domain protein [Blumeria hordei DH14]|uniref:RNA binding domain protein n=1 Tax=Blumeria graminis f. sp. hordei (strain DH14) TaxID=546991 RepID=N1J8A3_BLUG1|nr:RNA binding domain protein [Blumeria hordei DH14]